MSRISVLMTVGLVAVLVARGTGAQQPTRGLTVAPSYDGWEQNADGSFSLLFGYFNRNWDESVDVPIGPANSVDPGGSDQGQPTHFLPRRNQFVFKVRVPKDFGSREVVWTLTTRGKTEKAYGTLKPDYVLSHMMPPRTSAGPERARRARISSETRCRCLPSRVAGRDR